MTAWRDHRAEPLQWVDAARDELGPLTTWLDQFDERCTKAQEWVFVSYDHLDKIGIVKPKVRLRFAATLLAMWLSLANRYDRLRCKIFLRETSSKRACAAPLTQANWKPAPSLSTGALRIYTGC